MSLMFDTSHLEMSARKSFTSENMRFISPTLDTPSNHLRSTFLLSRPPQLSCTVCGRVLQTWMPSYHVRSSLSFPALPQFLNQEPPRPNGHRCRLRDCWYLYVGIRQSKERTEKRCDQHFCCQALRSS